MKKRILVLFSLIFVAFFLISCSTTKYNVDFDLNGGTSEAISSEVVKKGDLVTKPDSPKKEGYVFTYWANKETDEEWKFSENKVNSDITLVAQWKFAEYSVTFDAKSGTPTPEAQGLEHGEKAVEPKTAPTLADNVFLGWYYLDGEEKVYWDFDEPVYNDLLLYADWISVNDFINQDLNAIELVIENGKYILPNRGPVNNSVLLWSTDNPLYLTNRGIINRPTRSMGDQTVTLTATANYSGKRLTKDFKVTIPAKTESVVTALEDLPFTNLTSEYDVLDTTITTYFVDGGNIPYLDIESFLMLLDGLIYADELEFIANDQILEVSYEVTDEDEEETRFFKIVIDFFEDTIYVENMSFFSYYIKSTATDYSEGINYVDYYEEEGKPVTFELSKYFVDMFIYEEGNEVYYLVPYNFLSMIFTSETYYNFYYNGDGFYGFYAIPSANDEDDEYNTYETIKTSSNNKTSLPTDVAASSYHQLMFIFDYYFGLRYEDTYNIEESFYEMTTANINSFLGNLDNYNSALRSFVLSTIDELHSSYRFAGYYNDPKYSEQLSFYELGKRVQNWYMNGLWVVQDSIDDYHGSARPDWIFLDESKETAIIYLDGFLTASVDEEKNPETDSDAFMKNVLEEIHLLNPDVKNIGIDLSYNTGGNIGALFRVLGYITEKPIEMSYQDPLTGKNQTYFIELDTVAYEDVNWFFVTSPVTFSAANLMTAIVKNQNLGLIIGSTSGGGASSITPFVLSDGSMISISSNSVLSIRTDNGDGTYSYHSIEYGIEPDILLAPRHIQNYEAILEIINGYYEN